MFAKVIEQVPLFYSRKTALARWLRLPEKQAIREVHQRRNVPIGQNTMNEEKTIDEGVRLPGPNPAERNEL
jgi:hypothetical protein